MRPVAAFLFIMTFLIAAPEILAAGAYDPKISPSTEGGPVIVSVTFQVLDFARVNSRDESFDMTGYLETRWADPRLAQKRKPPRATVRYLEASQVWIPRLYFANALDQPRDHGTPDVEVDAEGNVSMGEIISGKFSAEFSLQGFPFDEQILPIRIGAYFDRSQIALKISQDQVSISRQAFLTDWNILGIGARETEEQYAPGSVINSLVVVETSVARWWTFYLWRVLFPMTLLVMVSWTVLWMDPLIAAPQATTAMGTLISLVAFNFTIDFAMPKVGYLTFIDRHALLGLAFVAAIVVEIAAAHYCIIRERPSLGRRIQKISRWIFPVSYFLAVAIEALFLLVAIHRL